MDGNSKNKGRDVKGVRSCQNCRKSKQRCDILDRSAIQPSLQPQPKQFSCHRCKVLGLACIIDVALVPEGQRHEIHWNDTSTGSNSPPVGSRRGSSSTLSNLVKGEQSVDSNVSSKRSRTTHVFEPSLIDGDASGPYRSSVAYERFPHSQHQPAPMDVEEKLQSLRPFQYLHRVCSAQPDFLAPDTRQDSKPSMNIRTLLDKHATSIDWNEMGFHLQEYLLHLPFLDPLDFREQAAESNGLYLATRLYLASLRTEFLDLQADLLLYLRSQTLSCALRGADSIEEAAALVALAVYEPLLLVSSAGQIQFDGKGLLAFASTASKTLHLESTPSRMRAFDFYSNIDPLDLLKRASLWATISFVSGINSLSSNYDQSPLIQCTIDDLQELETFCKRLLVNATPWGGQASLLLLLTFRHRSLIVLRDIVRKAASDLRAIPIVPLLGAESCLVEGNTNSYAFVKRAFTELKSLRQRLTLSDRTCDMFLDYAEFETMQLHTLCILYLTEFSLLRVAALYERPLDLASLIRLIVRDQEALHFVTTAVSTYKKDVSKTLVTLFSNFAFRWCKPSNSRQVQFDSHHRKSTSIALPPASLCAMMLSNVKTLVDFLLGYLCHGIYPQDCLDDCEVGSAACLCRMQAEAMLRLVNYQSEDLFHAKGHRDLFRLTSDITIRTSHAIYEWTAVQKGLRSADSHYSYRNRESLSAASQSYFNHSGNSSARPSMQDILRKTSTVPEIRTNGNGKDFERLLEEILSTPIVFW